MKTSDDIVRKINRHFSTKRAAERYGKPGEFYYRDDAVWTRDYLARETQGYSETTRKVLLEVIKSNPTNHSIAAACISLDALSLDEMNRAASEGLANIVSQYTGADIETHERYQRLHLLAENGELFSRYSPLD